MAKVLKFMVTAVVGGFFLIAIILIVGSLIGGSHVASITTTPAVTNSAPPPANTPASNQQQADTANPAPPAAPQIIMPADEARFIAILEQSNASYSQAANDMQKGAVRHQRAQAICAAFPTRTVSDWIGTISALDSTDKGNGILTLQLAQGVTAGTTNNEFSDELGTRTLIPVNSPLFQKVSGMKVGDTVSFSGKFLSSDPDCFELTDLTGDGSVQSPDFLIHFTTVDEATP